jgi:hypothetical protein
MRVKYRMPMDYFELIETFPKAGCAVCNLLLRDTDKAIDGLVYGFMDTDEMRAAFSAGRGLCSDHGWLLKQNKFGNVLGVAKLYAATLDEALRILEQTALTDAPQSTLSRLFNNGERRVDSSPLADQLEPTADCMICERIDERESDYIGIFGQYALDSRFQAAFSQSDGVCLPHLRQLLRVTQNPAAVETIISSHRTIWSQLKAEVESFALKQNYEHLDELTESEGSSWVRAITRMGGEKGLFGLRRRSR